MAGEMRWTHAYPKFICGKVCITKSTGNRTRLCEFTFRATYHCITHTSAEEQELGKQQQFQI